MDLSGADFDTKLLTNDLTLYLWNVPTDIAKHQIQFTQPPADSHLCHIRIEPQAGTPFNEACVTFANAVQLHQASKQSMLIDGQSFELHGGRYNHSGGGAGSSRDCLNEYLQMLDEIDEKSTAVAADAAGVQASVAESTDEATAAIVPLVPPFVCYLHGLSSDVSLSALFSAVQPWQVCNVGLPIDGRPVSLMFDKRDDLIEMLAQWDAATVDGTPVQLSLSAHPAPDASAAAGEPSPVPTDAPADRPTIVAEAGAAAVGANNAPVEPPTPTDAPTDRPTHEADCVAVVPAALPIESAAGAPVADKAPLGPAGAPRTRVFHPINESEIPFYPPFRVFCYGVQVGMPHVPFA